MQMLNLRLAFVISLVIAGAACAAGSKPSPDQDLLASSDWTITAPAAGATNSLRVMFPKPLDPAVLRALSVLAPNGRPLPGDAIVGQGELMWSFAPRGAWQAGDYQLVVGAARAGIPFRVR